MARRRTYSPASTGKRKLTRQRRPLRLDSLEDRTVPVNGQWIAVFEGVPVGDNLLDQLQYGRNLLGSAGVPEGDVSVTAAFDLSGTFLLQTPLNSTHHTVMAELEAVPGFLFVEEFSPPGPGAEAVRQQAPQRVRSERIFGPFDYDAFLLKEKNGEIPDQSGPVDPGAEVNVLTNNNAGSSGTAFYTQSETSLVAFGNTVVAGFNDSGSNGIASNKFTGFARSTDGGVTFTDGGTLPTNPNGDAGDPVMARNNTTGRIYYSTLQFSGSGINMFRSDDNGLTWSAPTQGAPGKSGFQDKQWIAVDNFAGPGNGNVYHVARDFGGGNGIYFFRSTDHGNTFGPFGGTLIASGGANNVQGAYVAVGADHSVNVFFFDENSTPERIMMRRSIDQGISFGAPVQVAVLGTGPGFNGDLGLVGVNNGEVSPRTIRSNAFPHAVVNPVSGHMYLTFADNPVGADKADVFVTVSTNGGATWGAPIKVNDDATLNDQWQPTLAVTPDGSKLGIFYYSRQVDTTTADGDPVNNQFRYFGRIASIVGSSLTFAPSFAISDVNSKPEVGRDGAVNTTYMGDYDQAVATPGAFHVLWSDNRALLPGGGGRSDPNVFYKRISLGLTVTSTVPAAGTTVSTVPVDYVVNFSDAIDGTSVQASDFTVTNDGGTPFPADSVLLNSPTQAVFHFNVAPFGNQGPHTMAMAAGSVSRLSDGEPLGAFSGTFNFDSVGLAVTTTVPPVGGIFTLPGPFTYDVNFNEPIAAASVGIDDLTLSVGTVTSAIALDPDTARYTLSGITAEGGLSITLGAGKVTDTFGNPNPAAFAGNYNIDIGTLAFPVPLVAKPPLGSLVYDPVASGVITPAGDTDTFTLNIDPSQQITVVVRPTVATLQPTVTLRDPNNFVLAATSAAAANQPAILQTVPTSVGGVYSITVGGVGVTTGSYTVQVILNAAEELERNAGQPTNNTAGTAQNLSMLNLGGSGSRGAVLGTIANSSDLDFYSLTLSASNTVTVALKGLNTTNVNVQLRASDGVTILASGVPGLTNLDRVLSDFVAATSGPFFVVVSSSTAGATYELVVNRNADFDIEGNNSIAAAQSLLSAQNAVGEQLTLGAIQSAGSALFATGNDGNSLITLNTGTGAGATVGSLGFSQTWAAAFTPDGTLWTIVNGFESTAARLANINPGTGLATPLGSVNWTGSPVIALEADAAGNLYGGSFGGTLFSVNKTTGLMTPIGPLGFSNIMDLAFDQAGTLWAVDGGNGLWRVNTTTGAGTFQTTIAGTNATVMGLMVDPTDSTMYATSYTGSSFLYRVNTTTGVATQVGSGVGIAFPHGGDFTTGGVGGDVDVYRIDAAAGAVLQFSTTTPADGSGEFVNVLNPRLRLLDAGGVEVASDDNGAPDGRNALLTFTVPTTGPYFVEVSSSAATIGEYVLRVTGNVVTPPPFQVTTTVPANGAVLLTAPALYTVNFNDAVLLSSLQASDLKVDGINATAFTVVDGDTVNFTLPGGLGAGTHTVTIVSGAVLDIQNTAIQPFSATFFLDNVAPRVVATSVAPGAVVAPGSLTYQVTFSEAMRVTNLTTDDFTLHGNFRQAVGVNYAPSSFSYNPGGTVLTLNYTGLPDDSYTLTLVAGVTGGSNFTDAVGNALDGEFSGTFPSGNGTAGGNFVIGFSMDPVTESYPTPLTAEAPNGSLIYDPSLTRVLAFAGDTDSFTIAVDAGQTITVLATPTTGAIQPTLEVRNPSNAVIGTATAPAAGRRAFVQTAPAATGGVYTITAGSVGAATGLYSVQVILNAALETESNDGTANDGLGTAQDIGGSFITLTTPQTNALRGAVSGTTDAVAGALSAEAEPNNTTATANNAAANFVAQPGTNLYHLGLKGNVSPSGDLDFYSLGQLQAGDIITITQSGTGSSRGTNGDTFVELHRGPAGAPILVTSNDDSGPGNDSNVFRFTVSITDTYYINARGFGGSPGTYDLGIFLENAGAAPTTGGTVTTETEPNNTAATATNASTSWRQVQFLSRTAGNITSGDVDVFSYQFTAGDLISVNIDSTSALDAQVRLRNAAGTIIASENGESLSGDSPIYSFIIPTTGTYFVETLASVGTGVYNADVYLSTGTPPPVPSPPTFDLYSFSLGAGETTTLGLKGLSAGNLSLVLLDAGGSPLATGVTGPTNLDRIISNFVAPAAGTYYARVGGDGGVRYNLVATRNAGFDTEGNDTSATAQSISGTQGALGHVTGGAAGSLFDLTGPTVTGPVVLSGTKITLGFNPDGSFITASGGTGILFNGVEFVVPGSPVASFTVGYNGLTFTNNGAQGISQISGITRQDISTGTLKGLRIVGTAGSSVQVERVVVFNQNDDFVTIVTRLTNTGGSALTNVATLENIDPDQDFNTFGNFATLNDVVLGAQFVRASGPTSGLTVGFGSADTRSVVSAEGFFNTNPFDIINSPEDPNGASGDIGINQAFNFGGLGGGSQVSAIAIMAFGTSAAAADAVFTANSSGTTVGNEDWYSINVTSTDNALRLETATPADGTGEFANTLNPKIELYNPSGVLVASGTPFADGRNEFIQHTPLTPGLYRVRVIGEGTTKGEYFLTKNFAPVVAVTVNSPIDENGTATVTGTISDTDSLDTHTVVITWGPGEGSTTLTLPAGVLTFSAGHQYLDDNPTGTASDIYPIGVTVSDNHGATGTASTSVTVNNVAPSAVTLNSGTINENGTFTLTGAFADAGTQDTHTVVINWGTGEGSTTLELPAGVLTFTASHQYLDDNPTGTASDVYTVTATVTDDDTGSGVGSASVTVNNVAPSGVTLNSGTIDENGTFTLSGSFTDPGTLDTHTVVINWGSGEGSTTLTLPAGVLTFTASHQYLDDNPTGTTSDVYTVTATVTDDDTGSAVGSATVTVNNVAPTVSAIAGPDTGARGQVRSYSATFSDVGTLDTHSALFNWDDGSTSPGGVTEAGGSGTVTGSHVYTATGVFTITLTVTDDDGGTVTVTKTVEIKAVDLQTDTTDPTKTQLVVGGTSGDDQIVLNPGGTGGTVQVIINGVVQGTFSPTGRVVVFGQAGNDNIQVAGGVNNTAWLYGDDGNDRLYGGDGNNVLLGGTGNDSILGGQGRDLIIGGTGMDRLRGNAADDILIGGSTIHDGNEAALFGIVSEWGRTDITRDQRIAHLLNGGGLNGSFKLDATSLVDDGEADVLTGSAGIDWFLAGIGDSITDEHEGETF